MKALRNLIVCCCVIGLGGAGARGAEIELVPIDADGAHSFNGTEIVLDGGGQRVFLEMYVSGWGPSELKTWQAAINSSTYASGAVGTLGPAYQTCTGDGDCVAAFGAGATCGYTGGGSDECTPGFIDRNRADYVFTGAVDLPAVDMLTLDYRFGSTMFSPASVPDGGGVYYAANLVLDVPIGAVGTFTIEFSPQPDSFMQDPASQFITPLDLTPAVITVLCQTGADCADGDQCTADVCQGNGTCANPPNYNVATECCDPATGDTTTIDDGNECTDNICDAETGIVSHPPLPSGTACGPPIADACDAQDTCDGVGGCQPVFAPAGTACGNQSDTDCTNPDTCDGLGACLDNHEVNGTPCGDASDTDCTDPDTCDGGGNCQDNDAPAGTACGDPTDTDCDNPDTCNGSGGCLDNLEPNGTSCDDLDACNINEACQSGICAGGAPPDCSGAGDQCNTASCDPFGAEGNCDTWTPVLDGTPCDDGLYCTIEEACFGGLCAGGQGRDCNDGVSCTDDSCNEANNQCDNVPNDGLCPDDGLFCNGNEYCNAVTDCDHTGSPCAGPCDEEGDICLCEAPIINYDVVSPRYVPVAIQPPDSGPQAIVLTIDCPGGPVVQYAREPLSVDLDGDHLSDEHVAILTDNPSNAAWHTPAEWGELYVTGELLTPNLDITVQGDCGSPGNPGLSDPSPVTTAIWGDVVGDFLSGGIWTPPNDVVDFVDIASIVDRFRATSYAPMVNRVDLSGANGNECSPQQFIDFIDILSCVEAFRGKTYTQTWTFCQSPCD